MFESSVIASAETSNTVGRPYRLVPSPTLVPSTRPNSKDDIASQHAAESAKSNSNGAVDRDQQSWVGFQTAQDPPKVPDANIELSEGSKDALELLRQLAQRSVSPTDAPAAGHTALPSYPAVVGMIAGLNERPGNAVSEPRARKIFMDA